MCRKDRAEKTHRRDRKGQQIQKARRQAEQFRIVRIREVMTDVYAQ